MTRTDSTAHLEQTWKKNLLALEAVCPELAGRLSGLPVSEGVVPTTGRDRSPSFRIVTSEGTRWFGHTSMPTISGPALLANFDEGSGNVILPGIGQGIEVGLLLVRLGPQRAVFVLDRDFSAVSLALRLHDWADAIREGRLVLVCAEGIGEAFFRFLVEHEGYLVPERMISWPWMSQPEIDEITLLMQQVSYRVRRHRAATMAELAGKLSGRYASGRPLPETPRLLVVCPTALGASRQLAEEAKVGAVDAGWPAELWSADCPGAAYSLSLVRRVLQFEPDLVLVVDGVRAGCGGALPEALPVVSWMTRGTRLPVSAVENMASTDRVFCEAGGAVEDLHTAGSTHQQVRWLPPAASRSAIAARESTGAHSYEMVAIADAGSLSPQAYGLSLDSHLSAWKMAEQLIRKRAERYTDDHADALLSEIESATGVHLGDRVIRRSFCDQVNRAIAQTLVCRAVFEAALRGGLPLAIWGNGWQGDPVLEKAWRGPVRFSDRAWVCAGAKVVLHVDVTGNVSSELLSAAASGAAVLARAHPTDPAQTGLSHLLQPGRDLITFGRFSEMLTHARRLLSDDPWRASLADRARRTVIEHHRMAHRMATLRQALC